MIGKEALNIIHSRLNSIYDYKVCYGDDVDDLLDIIKQDLERLEELKLCFECETNYAGNTYVYCKSEQIGIIWADEEDNDDDLVMIKEWLKNE